MSGKIELKHPCKGHCSGWEQGYDCGYAQAKNEIDLKVKYALKTAFEATGDQYYQNVAIDLFSEINDEDTNVSAN